MIPLPALSAIPWKLVGYGIAIGALLLLGWRIHAWREAYKALPATQEALQNEQACGEGSECQKRAAALEATHRAATAVVVQEYTREIESLRSQPIPRRVIRVCRDAGPSDVRHASTAQGTGGDASAPAGLDRADEYPTAPFREYARDAAALAAQCRAIIQRDVALATPPK